MRVTCSTVRLVAFAVLLFAGSALAQATECSAFGQVSARFPGFDVQPGVALSSPVVASEDACLALCLQTVTCSSAVFVTPASRCYLKEGGLDLREGGYPDRFVLVGCVEQGICPVGSTQERYPGFDVLPGTNVGSAVVASEDACVQLCEDAPQCLSAVFVTNSLACYLKAGSLKLRESGFADRFVVVGCAGPSEAECEVSADCEASNPGFFCVDGSCSPDACGETCEDGTFCDTGVCVLCESPERIPGYDIDAGMNRGAAANVLSEADCLDLCVLDPGCKSAVYTSSQNCYLKDRGPLDTAVVGDGTLSNLVVLWCKAAVPGCNNNSDCSPAGSYCTDGACGDRPTCQFPEALPNHRLDGENLAVIGGLTKDQCRDRCLNAVYCKGAVYNISNICYLKATNPALAYPDPSTTGTVLRCLDPKAVHMPMIQSCSRNNECLAPGQCVAGTCTATYEGDCPELAKEQIVTSGGAINNPISNASGPVLLDFDVSREELCASELNGDQITVSGQVVVRRTRTVTASRNAVEDDDDEGDEEGGQKSKGKKAEVAAVEETVCEYCPEAECYMWIPNEAGTYVPECSAKLMIDQYGKFTITSNEPGSERDQGWGPDPYGHWHFDCLGCGGRFYNKFYRQVPDYVGENKAVLSAALGNPDESNALTPVAGSTTQYTYTIVLEEGTFTRATQRTERP